MKRLLALLLSVISCGAQAVPEGAPEVYEYTENACYMYPRYYYKVDTGEDGVQRLYYSMDTNEISIIRLKEDVLSQIGAIVAENKLHRLKESYTPLMQVLDGYTWRLEIKYSSAKIYSTGQNARPKQSQRDAIDTINNLLQSIADAAAEEDIIGQALHYERNSE